MSTVLDKPEALTDRQWQIFLHYWEATCRDGFQPSMREVADMFGYASQTAVVEFILALERKGWIKSCKKQSRAIRFLRQPNGEPFRGFVPA